MKNIIWILLVLIQSLTAQNSAIEKILENRYPAGQPGVSVLISRGGRTVLEKSYGMADVELKVKSSAEDIYKIASITKPFTALAIFLLENRKLLSIDDPVVKYITGLPDSYSDVRIKHLLSHTSGIPDYDDTEIFSGLFIKRFFDLVSGELSSDSLLARLRAFSPQFVPGKKFSYSNSGYFLLERIIEKVSGIDYGEFLKKNIFEPLNMTRTRLYSNIDIIPGRVPGYTDVDGTTVRNPFGDLSGIMPRGAGSIMSCVDDLYRFAQSISQGGYFYKIAKSRFYEPFVLNDGNKSVYSLGMFSRNFLGRKLLNHNGDSPGFASTLVIVPGEEIIIIILGNSDLYSLGSSRYHEITARRIAALFLNAPFPSFKKFVLAENFMKQYAGKYISKDNLTREISCENNRLYIKRGPGRKREIIPFAENKFFYKNYLIYLEFVPGENESDFKMIMHYDDGRKTVSEKLKGE